MATYYIDFDTGNDSNNGTSTGTPWKHCPSDSNATGTASSTSLVAGDTALFKGGVSYVVGTITLSWSGGSGNPITYDGNSAGTWGSGKAIITSNNVDTKAMQANASRSNLQFKNFHFKDIGGYADDDPIWLTTDPITNPPQGTGIYIFSGGSNILVEDCIFEEIGQWINAIPMSGAVSITGAGLAIQNVTNLTVRRCEFTKMKIGIELKVNGGSTTGPVLITECNFHDYLVWGMDVAPRSTNSTFTDVTIEKCNWYNYSQYDSGNWQAYGEKPHRDGIFFRTAGIAGSTWNNVIVRNCKWWDDTPGNSNGGTASLYISQGPSIQVYNNIFLLDPQANGHISIGGTNVSATNQNILIANNTFVTSERAVYVSSGDQDQIIIKNNVFYHQTSSTSGHPILLTSSVVDLQSNNNLFFSNVSPLSNTSVVYNGSYRTLSNWQAYSGEDANSILADPQVVSVSGTPSLSDVRPTSSSPLIGAGENLSSYFTTDRDGVSRGSTWDIGAYEFDTSSSNGSGSTKVFNINKVINIRKITFVLIFGILNYLIFKF